MNARNDTDEPGYDPDTYSVHLAPAPTPAVYQAIAKVTGLLSKEGIAKNKKNEQQGYKFRGIDDVYNALSAHLADVGLCILPRVLSRAVTERTTQRGGVLFYTVLDVEFDFVAASDASKHTVRAVGEAMDSGDKSTNKAMSAAYKYACMQVFCIPTEGDNDADKTTHEVAPKMVHDPKGDLGQNVPTDKAVALADAMREIMGNDAFEPEMAADAYALHEDVMTDHDLYVAASELMKPAERAAWKKLIQIHRKAQPIAANGRA